MDTHVSNHQLTQAETIIYNETLHAAFPGGSSSPTTVPTIVSSPTHTHHLPTP